MKITDKFGITEKELKAIKEQADYLISKGYKVPDIVVKVTPGKQGCGAVNEIWLNPNTNTEQLKRTLAHEVGHFNEPQDWATYDIWEEVWICKIGGLNWKQEAQKVSDYATKSIAEFWAESFAESNTI